MLNYAIIVGMLVHSYSQDTLGTCTRALSLSPDLVNAHDTTLSSASTTPKTFFSLGSSSDLCAVKMYLSRITPSNLLQNLCWAVLVLNAPSQEYLPAALVSSLAGDQIPDRTPRNKSFAALNQMPLQIVSSLLTPGYQKALGMDSLVTARAVRRALVPALSLCSGSPGDHWPSDLSVGVVNVAISARA